MAELPSVSNAVQSSETLRNSLGLNYKSAALPADLRQRTLRIPDDGKIYPLPAGFGRFPLRHVDDYKDTVPAPWTERGGVLMPMYQSEALWIRFSTRYPFAVKVAAGKINAVTGDPWSRDLQADPQNYLVLPEQPWRCPVCGLDWGNHLDCGVFSS